jgi:hypothetical protein
MKSLYLVPAISLLAPAAAFAQPPTDATDAASNDASAFDHHVAAPGNAFELGVATGYTQGAGPVGGNLAHLEDLSGAGAAVELDASYRINPTFSIGAYGTFSKYATGDLVSNADVLGAAAGIQAAAHLRPDRSVDPWVSLGAGWKGLWLNADQGKNTSLQGLDLARLQIGVDYRVSKDIAISPVIGGSLGLFVSQDSPMTTDYTELSDKKVNFTGFAGLAGRFDLGGDR